MNRKTVTNLSKIAGGIALAFALAACGGGDDGAPPASKSTAKIIDTPPHLPVKSPDIKKKMGTQPAGRLHVRPGKPLPPNHPDLPSIPDSPDQSAIYDWYWPNQAQIDTFSGIVYPEGWISAGDASHPEKLDRSGWFSTGLDGAAPIHISSIMEEKKDTLGNVIERSYIANGIQFGPVLDERNIRSVNFRNGSAVLACGDSEQHSTIEDSSVIGIGFLTEPSALISGTPAVKLTEFSDVLKSATASDGSPYHLDLITGCTTDNHTWYDYRVDYVVDSRGLVELQGGTDKVVLDAVALEKAIGTGETVEGGDIGGTSMLYAVAAYRVEERIALVVHPMVVGGHGTDGELDDGQVVGVRVLITDPVSAEEKIKKAR